MKTLVTFVVELCSSRRLIPERAWRRLSKGSTDSLLGVGNTSRYASSTLCKFPTAAASRNVISSRLRYLRPGASISSQAPMLLSTVIFNLFKEDGTRIMSKDSGLKESSRFSRTGQAERRICTELKFMWCIFSSCSTFNDGKQTSEGSCNGNKI